LRGFSGRDGFVVLAFDIRPFRLCSALGRPAKPEPAPELESEAGGVLWAGLVGW